MNQTKYFKLPFLYPIINLDTLAEPISFLCSLLRAGLNVIQIRAKNIDDKTFLSFAKEAASICSSADFSSKEDIYILINDRIDICVLSNASGVHLGQNDVPVEKARGILGDKAIIGLSTHNIKQIKLASKTSSNYLGFGPIFNTSSKDNLEPLVGVKALEEALTISTKPLVAIGGITTKNTKDIYKTGVSSVAVLNDLEKATNVENVVNQYKQIATKHLS